jgi:zinc protease
MRFIRLSLRFATVTAMLLSASVGTNAQDLSAKLPRDPNVVVGKLSNGLTYYIRTNKKPSNKVELRLAVKAGSILENDDQQGLAHFMEHMNFNGTKNFKKNDLVGYLQSIGVEFGADLNAYTGFDQTVYILPIPTDKAGNLEKGFQIIEDWAHNALLTDKDIDEERGVVLEESRLGKGAEDRMLKKYFPKLAQGTLYAERLPIGRDDILKNFKYDKVRSFYKDWYRPNLQAVMVVGDIDVATAKKMITDHFGGLKNPANERPRTYADVKPRNNSEAMVVTDKEASNTILMLQYPYMKESPSTTVGDYRGDIVENLATAMINKRFNELSQSANPPFAFAGGNQDGMVHGYKSFSVFAVLGNDGVEKGLNAVTAELLKAQKFGFNEGELELAKKNVLSNIEKAYNERQTTKSDIYIDELVRVFLDEEAFPGIENEYNYHKSMLPTIKVAEVNELVKKWLTASNTFTLVMAPEKELSQLPSDAQLLAMTRKGFSQEVSKPEERTVASSLITKEPTPGKVTNTTKESGFDATTYTLSNGVKITIKPTKFKSDEILMKGVKKGGSSNYGVDDRNNVKFATELMDNMGYAEFNPTQIEEILAGRKIEALMSIGDITSEIKCSSTIKDFEAMLQLTYLQITAPRKDEALFAAYKEKQRSMLQYMSANPQAAFMDTTIKSMFNNNPLARVIVPKPSDFDKINLDRAIAIYKQQFGSADGYHFFIVGNIDEATAIPLLEKYLGSVPANSQPVAFKDNGVRMKKGNNTFKFSKGKEKQSMIVVFYGGEAAYSEDLALRANALSEVLNIKVTEDLREKMGAIYGGGFNANVSKEPYERYAFQLYLPCGPENVDKLVAAANDEITAMKEKGPDEKDLVKVKTTWMEKHKVEEKENKYWQDKMERVMFWGRDKDRVLNYETYINKLTTKQLQETAKQLFSNNNQFTAILYPES